MKQAPKALRERLAKRQQEANVRRSTPYVDKYAEDRKENAKRKEAAMIELRAKEESEKLSVLARLRSEALANKAARERAEGRVPEDDATDGASDTRPSGTVSVPKAGRLRGSIAQDVPHAAEDEEQEYDLGGHEEMNASSTHMDDGIDGCASKASPFPDRVPMPRLSPTRPVTDGEAGPDVVAVSDDTEANDDEERRSRSSGSLSSSGAASSTAGNAWRRVPTGSRRRGDNLII